MTRPPPADAHVEAQLLSAVMIDPEQWAVVADLPAAAFHSPGCRGVFEAMTALHAQGLPTDDLGLIAQQGQQAAHPQFDLAFLAGVVATEASGFYASEYAAVIRALYGRRLTIHAAHRLIHHAAEGDLDGEALATLASQVGGGLDIRKRRALVTHAQAIDAALAELDSKDIDVIRTGFTDLDREILGFEPGALYVLAARPAMGKTGLGYSFVLNAAREGHGVAVASLEMSPKSLSMRALATAASVDLNRIRQRALGGPERERLKAAGHRLRTLPINFMDATDQTGASIARDARALHAAGKLDLLLIDYLQLIESGKAGGENRQQEVSQISRSLKKLAMELQIPVVVLSQLSRAVEARPTKRPMLSDLRESGAIEQDADTVMFIYRDEYYHPKTDQQGIAEIIIGKQRNGPVGSVYLSYSSEFVRFGNLAGGQS